MTARHVSRRDLLAGRTRSGRSTPARRDVPAAQESDAFLVRVQRRIMACQVEVVLRGESSDSLPIARAALDEGDRLEEVMTIFRDSSELTRINRQAHDAPVAATAELFAVLQQSARIHDETEGAFDITTTALSGCWGFLRREGRLPSGEAIAAAREVTGMHLVELDARAQSVYFRRPGVSLNLGSIGKGFAIDRMGHFLRREGVNEALISAGSSSILALGGTSRPWQVDLRSVSLRQAQARPNGGRLARLWLTDAAVGTSGAGEQFFECDGVRYGHVIDPRTGWPASGVVSASVITSSAASADALSTAFLIGGAALAERYCAAHPGVLAIVTPDPLGTPLVFGSFPGASVELT
jgi:thiamine biosynthesis lipoprotein